MKNQSLASWFLRLGIAFCFVYAGVASFVTPSDWVGYLPGFIHSGRFGLLKLFSSVEIVLAIWLFVGRYTKYAAGLSALMFAGIVVVNPYSFIVTFRDVGLVFAALALMALPNQK